MDIFFLDKNNKELILPYRIIVNGQDRVFNITGIKIDVNITENIGALSGKNFNDKLDRKLENLFIKCLALREQEKANSGLYALANALKPDEMQVAIKNIKNFMSDSGIDINKIANNQKDYIEKEKEANELENNTDKIKKEFIESYNFLIESGKRIHGSVIGDLICEIVMELFNDNTIKIIACNSNQDYIFDIGGLNLSEEYKNNHDKIIEHQLKMNKFKIEVMPNILRQYLENNFFFMVYSSAFLKENGVAVEKEQWNLQQAGMKNILDGMEDIDNSIPNTNA